MSPRRAPRPPRDEHDGPEQLPLVASSKPRAARPDPDQVAKLAIARRTTPSAKPGYVRLMLTLEVSRELAERLSARASGPFPLRAGGKNFRLNLIDREDTADTMENWTAVVA